MERLRAAEPIHATDAGCVQCSAPIAGERCASCGIACAPGGYRVEKVIARGPHSRVYLAADERGARVAVKELLFAVVPDVKELDAFERESETLRALSHPSIPRFVRSFSEGAGAGLRLYLVQEHVDGETLADLLRRGPVPESRLRSVARQALEVLDHLHEQSPSLLHRDVKPANLILRRDGRLALVDFGTARVLQRSVTHGSTLVGTFGYIAPEQLGGTVDRTSDLYGLGATLVHLAAGKHPSDLLGPDLQLRLPEGARLSASFRKLIERLVARDRRERFDSAAEALRALGTAEPARAGAASRARYLLAALAAVAAVVTLSVASRSVDRSEGKAEMHGPVVVRRVPSPTEGSSGITPPQLVIGRQVAYTGEARAAGAKGKMRVTCRITEGGQVDYCRVIRGLTGMNEEVLDALQTRQYRPARLGDMPVAGTYVFEAEVNPSP